MKRMEIHEIGAVVDMVRLRSALREFRDNLNDWQKEEMSNAGVFASGCDGEEFGLTCPPGGRYSCLLLSSWGIVHHTDVTEYKYNTLIPLDPKRWCFKYTDHLGHERETGYMFSYDYYIFQPGLLHSLAPLCGKKKPWVALAIETDVILNPNTDSMPS